MRHLIGQTDWPLFIKAWGAVIMGFVLFIGSIYVLLAAVFGRRMGYLVLGTMFFGWMIILSSLWTFGFFSQGIPAKGGITTNLGPRGTEPHWQPMGGGFEVVSEKFPEVKNYPSQPWQEPDSAQEASVQPLTTAVQTFMSDQANAQAGIEPVDEIPVTAGGTLEQPEDEVPYLPEQFDVQDVRFAVANDGTTSLAAARASFVGGGPQVTVFAYHDKGDVAKYSYLFLAASVIGFGIHLPFLDRAERKRKDILTGGKAPVWRGPA